MINGLEFVINGGQKENCRSRLSLTLLEPTAMKAIPLIVSICLLFAFCDSSKTIDDPLLPDKDAEVKTVPAFPNLTFRRPVDLQQPNDQSNRLFVVEQAGIISVFLRDAQ